MAKKKNDDLWFPAWIICPSERIIEGWVSKTAFDKSQKAFKMVIDEKYQVDATEILCVRDALVVMGTPSEVCVN